MAELVLRFLLIGALAFGGGQAALPLVERLAVGDTAWLTPAQFAAGVGLSYAAPGPVLILAAFVGYHVAGVPGAVAASVAVFAIPVALAGLAAQLAARFGDAAWFKRFGRFAGAAAVRLLGVTLVAMTRPILAINPALAFGAVIVLAAERLGAHPVVLIGGAAALGAAASLLGWPP